MDYYIPKDMSMIYQIKNLIALGTLVLFSWGCQGAVDHFEGERGAGQLTACSSNLKNIGTAAEMYSTDYQGFYPTEIGLLTPNYLKTIPSCPAAGSDTYSSDFTSNTTELLERAKEEESIPVADAKFYVSCSGDHHSSQGLPADHPAYDSMTGLIRE